MIIKIFFEFMSELEFLPSSLRARACECNMIEVAQRVLTNLVDEEVGLLCTYEAEEHDEIIKRVNEVIKALKVYDELKNKLKEKIRISSNVYDDFMRRQR